MRGVDLTFNELLPERNLQILQYKSVVTLESIEIQNSTFLFYSGTVSQRPRRSVGARAHDACMFGVHGSL